MRKTKTIKARAVYVYLPSVEQKERWSEYAKQQGVSISKFVVEHVEDSLSQVEDSSYKSSGELWTEVRELKEQLSKVTREVTLMRKLPVLLPRRDSPLGIRSPTLL